MGVETINFINDMVVTNPIGATDPKSEGDNHIRNMKTGIKATFPGFAGRFRRIQAKSATYVPVLNDNSSILRTSGTFNLNLTAAATLGDGWEILVFNDGAGIITIDPDAAETINGAATLVLAAGTWVIVQCNGSAFFALRGTVDGAPPNKSVTYAKIQNVSATDRLLGRATAGAGDVEEIICTAAGRALLDDANAAAQLATIGALSAPVLEGDLGALAVTEGKLGNGSVSQQKLKSTFGDATDTVGGTQITLPGGLYGFWPQVKDDNNLVGACQYTTARAVAAFTSCFFLSNNGDGTATVRQQYISTSPPYDLGDGEIPLFIFIQVSPLGKIVSCYVAPEAPWHNNGPTNIRPDIVIAGKKYIRRQTFFQEFRNVARAKKAGLSTTDILLRLKTDPIVNIEVDQAMKQADMVLIPHPWGVEMPPGNKAILLDPVSPLCRSLFELHVAGESVVDLLHGDYFTLSNQPLVRNNPPGVISVAANWKLTP